MSINSVSSTMLRLPDVRRKTGLGRSTILAQVAAGLLPPPIKLGARAVGWVEGEIDAILTARIAGAGTDKVKGLVAELVAARSGEGEGARQRLVRHTPGGGTDRSRSPGASCRSRP
jgi:prophage regulatory protein